MIPVLGIIVLIAFLTLVFTLYIYRDVMSKPAGNAKMQEISAAIREGAITFLRREYRVLAVFLFVLILVIMFTLNEPGTGVNEGIAVAIACLVGALCSVLAGFVGMRIATSANVRTTEAARKSFHEALSVAFSSGSVMGLTVVSVGLLGLIGVMSLFNNVFNYPLHIVVKVISGFGLGASSIALFARVGGGSLSTSRELSLDFNMVQQRVTEDCGVNQAIRQIGKFGQVVCVNIDTSSGVQGSGTSGRLAWWTSSNQIGSPSGITTDGNDLVVSSSVTAQSFVYSSDERLKHDIQTIENPLQTVQQLRGVTFKWNETNTSSVGFVAQEVERILPELVRENDWGLKSVEYANIVALLVEAIKEQQQQIDQLEKRLGELE